MALSKSQWKLMLEQSVDDWNKFQGRVCVNVSGGAASAVAWKRCLDRFGQDRVVPVFADTNFEHDDLYRFLKDCETCFGQQLTRLNDGRDIWDVFNEYSVMRIGLNGQGCKASVELKQKPLKRFFEQSGCEGIAVGLNFDEPKRMISMRKKYRRILFPLAVRPFLSDCEILKEVERFGIKPPQIYDDGYTHNNCAGMCILAGIGQWAANRKRDPDAFQQVADKEAVFIDKTGFSILKRQIDGKKKQYPLRELANDQDRGQTFPNDWRSNCACMTLFETDELV